MALVLSDQHFGLNRGSFALNMRAMSAKGAGFFCLFGEFIPRKPHPATDQAYQSLKEISKGLSAKGIICCVANVEKFRTIISYSSRTETPINSLPKLMLFDSMGIVSSVYSGQVPKTPAYMQDFVMKNFPRPPRSAPSRREESYYDEESSSEEADEPEPTRRGSSRSSKKSAGYQPDFGNVPRVGEFMRGRGRKAFDQDDGEEFLIPKEVTPHNTPWATDLD